MSDLGRIVEGRTWERNNTTEAARMMMSAEHSADSLEGIRQDLTLISGQLTHIVQALTALAPKR